MRDRAPTGAGPRDGEFPRTRPLRTASMIWTYSGRPSAWLSRIFMVPQLLQSYTTDTTV